MAQAPEDIERGRIASRQEVRECAPNTAFDERPATVGLASDLFYQWAGNKEKHEYHVNLGNLHRMMLHGLQKELVDEIAEIYRKGTVDKAQRDKIRILLRDYISAIRDWETMVSYASDNPFIDPFILTSEKPLDLKLMFEAGLRPASDRANKRIQTAINNDDVILPPVPHRTRKYHKRDLSFREFWARFYMAFFGGLALVGPMLIMVLYKHRYTSIVTVSISVFLFAVAVAAFSTEKPTTVLGAVAAYAAVLVVFLGTSS